MSVMFLRQANLMSLDDVGARDLDAPFRSFLSELDITGKITSDPGHVWSLDELDAQMPSVTKDLVNQWPKKEEKPHRVRFGQEQRRLYSELIEKARHAGRGAALS